MPAPAWSGGACGLVGITEIVGPVLSETLDQECSLSAIFRRLRRVGVAATVGDDELVDREALRAGDLDEDAVAVGDGGLDRFRQYEVQEVQRLRVDTKGFERTHAFLILERWRQKLDQCRAASLAPAPCRTGFECRHGLEGEVGEDARDIR